MATVASRFDFARPADRLRFLLEDRWRGDMKTMAQQSTLGASRLRRLLHGKISPTNADWRCFGKHNFINKVWLRTGEGRPYVRPSEVVEIAAGGNVSSSACSGEESAVIATVGKGTGKGTGRSSDPLRYSVRPGTVGRINDIWNDPFGEDTARMAVALKVDQEKIERVLCGFGTSREIDDIIQGLVEWTGDVSIVDWVDDGKGERPVSLGGKPKVAAPAQPALEADETLVQLGRLIAKATSSDQIKALSAQVETLTQSVQHLLATQRAHAAALDMHANSSLGRDGRLFDLEQRLEQALARLAAPDVLVTEEAVAEIVSRLINEARIRFHFELGPRESRPQSSPQTAAPVLATVPTGSNESVASVFKALREVDLNPELRIPVQSWLEFRGPVRDASERTDGFCRSLSQLLRNLTEVIPSWREAASATAQYAVGDLRLVGAWMLEAQRRSRPFLGTELLRFLVDHGRVQESTFEGGRLMPLTLWVAHLPQEQRERLRKGVAAPMGKRIRCVRERLGLPETPKELHYVRDMRCHRDYLFQLTEGENPSADGFLRYWRRHHPGVEETSAA